MADDDDDLAGAIDHLATVNAAGNAISALNSLASQRQQAALQEQLSALQQAEQARQRAEAARVEQEYLSAHCPWCHTSLAGTPAVCAACTRDIVWLHMPLDVAIVEFISDNLHTFKEVYRELLGASVLFDWNQSLVHVPLSSQQEVAESQKRLQPLIAKLNAYIDFFCQVVERRQKVVGTCSKCHSEVFERVLVPAKKGNDRICPPCELGDPIKSAKNTIALSFVGAWLGWFAALYILNATMPNGSEATGLIGAGFTAGAVMWIGFAIHRWTRASRQNVAISNQKIDLISSAEFPMNALSLGAKTTNGLFNLIDLRTKALEELLARVDEAALPKRIAPESGDAGWESANQREAVATSASEPVMSPFKTPIRNVVVSRAALTADAAEFTAVGKQKPLSADSPTIRAVALALVAMKTFDAATVRACEDRLARKLIEIAPYELTKSVRIVGAGVKEAKLQFVFEQLCDSLKAEPEFMKPKHRAVAEVIAELLPKESAAVPGNANGPKVIRALCKVLNS